MKVMLLGTSCGVPTSERGLPAVAVCREREILLFDCGEGTQRQMVRFGLSFMKVDRIFLTHFHGDHYLGLFGLTQSMSFFGRQKPLHMYGPPGMEAIAETVSCIGNFRAGFKIVGHDIGPGDSVACQGYAVTPAAVDHLVPTLGYILQEDQRPGKFDVERASAMGIPPGRLYKELQMGRTVRVGRALIAPEQIVGPPRPGRKIVYLGDVLPSSSVVKFCRNADLLICEATFCEDLADRARETGHSTVRLACEIAAEAGVKRLLLTHFSPRYDEEAISEEITFRRTIVGRDGLTLEVRYSDS